MSNNLLRILTGLVGIPVVVGLAYLGGWPFFILVGLMALPAQYEVYHLLRAAGQSPMVGLGLVLGAFVLLSYMVAAALGAAFAVLVAAIAISPLVRSDRVSSSERSSGSERRSGGSETATSPAGGGPTPMAATLFGVIYPTTLLGFLVAIRQGGGPSGFAAGAGTGASVTTGPGGETFALTIAVLILVWTTDTLAYFVGRAIGKRPLAPSVSPKKTWEGTLGGLVGALVAGVALKLTLLTFVAWPHVFAIALLCGLLGQLGDLAESKMKRAVGVKDSGALLPGHGGMLDRFDSMIVVAPAVYLYLHYVAGVLE